MFGCSADEKLDGCVVFGFGGIRFGCFGNADFEWGGGFLYSIFNFDVVRLRRLTDT